VGIELDGTQIVAIAAFLRVINTLENIRQSIMLLESSLSVSSPEERKRLLQRAAAETGDSIRVLEGGGLHPDAVAHLRDARRMAEKAVRSVFFNRKHTEAAIRDQKKARAVLVD